MLKKFLYGLVFGAGFSIAFIGIQILSIKYIMPKVFEDSSEFSRIDASNDKTIDTAPPIKNARTFLGATGSYSRNFLDNKEGSLSGGEGVITGKAYVNDEPLEGLKLSLALNGIVTSQWATTGSNGVYRINVPFGEYRIDGFEFNYSNVNKLLPNKIHHPQNSHLTEKFLVSKDQESHGIDFKFTDPVVKIIEKTKYKSNDKIIIKWETYPNAKKYNIQIYEKKEPDTWRRKKIFSRMRGVTETKLDLEKQNVKLKPDYFYSYHVLAVDDKENIISNTHEQSRGFDFKITN